MQKILVTLVSETSGGPVFAGLQALVEVSRISCGIMDTGKANGRKPAAHGHRVAARAHGHGKIRRIVAENAEHELSNIP